MKPLTVYKASAGSGKTFTLAVEYIKLLIKNPWSYKNILAVTFTNKATEEMKLRILSQLYGLWKMLPDSETYMQVIATELGLDRQIVSRQAGIALSSLIHNYNYFRVETIDSFFQSILRNLARELDLTANLRVTLNDKDVEEMAVDKLIDALDTNDRMLKWLISYIFSNIDDNKSWNVIRQVKDFGKNIFQDFYKVIGEELGKILSEEDFFDSYTKQMRHIRDDAKRRMSEYADIFEEETKKAGLTPESYANKRKGISSYFRKLRSDKFSNGDCLNKTTNDCLENAEKWSSKSSPDRDVILKVVNEKLLDLLKDAEKERPKQWRLYASATITLRHLNKLRLLNHIDKKVRELNDEANRFMLGDTQYLLNTLIKDSDSPFIFEKAGCRLEHIMIDEFQDTSSIQWQNFKVLLKECMSHRHDDNDTTIRNLIVGDVKQSIYRWRSGDWRLLNNIDKQFNHPEENIEVRSLQTNYRSGKNIVDFNNVFFSIAVKKEYCNELDINTEETAKELMAAYEDVRQASKDKSKGKGLVRVTMLPKEEYEENMLNSVEGCVDELMAAGIPMNKIAVLIRYNDDISLIADYFMTKRPELKIVSDEAFRLESSLSVSIIIQALNLLLHPDDILIKAGLAMAYQRNILKTTVPDSQILTNFISDEQQSNKLLPEKFVAQYKDLPGKPLLDIIEDIYSAFELDKLEEQNAYICAFYDQVSDFVGNNSGNINLFIEEWNASIHRKTIQSDEINGIRLISIHKSKGLEFDNVIIPFCDWPLESDKTTLWCNPKEEPFNRLPLVPVSGRKNLLETIFADDYRNEHIQNSVDNLNLLYVAFTRASKNLFIFGQQIDGTEKRPNRSKLLCQSLADVYLQLEQSTLIDNTETDEGSPIIFEYGDLFNDNSKKEDKISDNVFLHETKTLNIKIDTFDTKVEFRQSNKSREFIENNDEDDNNSKYIKAGNIMHKIFSMIHTTEDIDRALKQMEFDGVLYDNEITVEKMRDILSKRLSDKRVAEWFSPRWQVFNECSIIYVDPDTGKVMERRPDRVIYNEDEMIVIDFKFGKPQDKYHDQIKQYVDLLETMGYKNIKSYLWFVYSNKIEEVKH